MRGLSRESDRIIKGKIARQTRYLGFLWAISALILLTLVIFGNYASPERLNRNEGEIFTRFSRGVVKVFSPDKTHRGTGFLISTNKILTNAHVVKENKEMDIVFYIRSKHYVVRGKVILNFYKDLVKSGQ